MITGEVEVAKATEVFRASSSLFMYPRDSDYCIMSLEMMGLILTLVYSSS